MAQRKTVLGADPAPRYKVSVSFMVQRLTMLRDYPRSTLQTVGCNWRGLVADDFISRELGGTSALHSALRRCKRTTPTLDAVPASQGTAIK